MRGFILCEHLLASLSTIYSMYNRLYQAQRGAQVQNGRLRRAFPFASVNSRCQHLTEIH